MPGTRIKRAEAEAMFADFLGGMTFNEIARKSGRSSDRVRALAKRDEWNQKVADAHAEVLARTALDVAKEDALNIKALIQTRNMLITEIDRDWQAKKRSGVPRPRRVETLLKAVDTLDGLLGMLAGRGKPGLAVAVSVGISAPPLFTPAEVAALAAQHERLRIEAAKPVEVQIEDAGRTAAPRDEEQNGSRADREADRGGIVEHGSILGVVGASMDDGSNRGNGAGIAHHDQSLPRTPWECPHAIGSPECGYRGIAGACDGKLETCKGLGNQAHYGGRPMTPEERATNQRPGNNGGAE